MTTTRSASRLRSAKLSAANHPPSGKRPPSKSAAPRSSMGSDPATSDSDGKPVREKLKNTKIHGPSDEPPRSDPTDNEARKRRAGSPLAEDADSEAGALRGRPRRKRSFEVFSDDDDDAAAHDTDQDHTRKKSREGVEPRSSSATGQDGGSDTGAHVQSAAAGTNHSPATDSPDASPQQNATSEAVVSATESPDTTAQQDAISVAVATAPKKDEAAVNATNKRSRAAYLEGQHDASPTSKDDCQPTTAKSDAKQDDTERGEEEPKPKRHRDSSSPESGGQAEKVSGAHAKGDKKSTVSEQPATILASTQAKAKGKVSETSAEAFKASGFSSFAAAPSALSALGQSSAKSAWNAGSGMDKTPLSSFASLQAAPGTTGSATNGFAALASAGPTGFAAAITTDSQKEKSAFGGGIGGGFGALGGGFGALSQGGLKSFATPGTVEIVGLSDKAVKPFGTAKEDEDGLFTDEDEDEGTTTQADEGAAKKQEDSEPDTRFVEQNVATGEEHEETMWNGRAKLLTFCTQNGKKQWKDRGQGMLKLNLGKASPRTARFILRAEGTHRLILNCRISKNLDVGNPDGSKPTDGRFQFVGFAEGDKGAEGADDEVDEMAEGFKMAPQMLRMKPPSVGELYDAVQAIKDKYLTKSEADDTMPEAAKQTE